MPSNSVKLAAAAVMVAVGAAAVLHFSPKEEKVPEAQGNEISSFKQQPFDVNKYASKEDLSKALCAFVAQAAKESIESRGVFHLAVAGGSLLDTLTELFEHKDIVDFSKVVLSFVNHKCVDPNDSKKSNFAKSKKKFAEVAGINRFIEPVATPVDGGEGIFEAEFYEKELRDAGIPHKNGFPVFDLIILGLGTDGHIGSCHPMSPAVLETNKSVTASQPQVGEPASITFTIETINSSRLVAVVVAGGSRGKNEAVRRAMIRPAEGPRGTFPAQLLARPIFFLDAEAASGI